MSIDFSTALYCHRFGSHDVTVTGHVTMRPAVGGFLFPIEGSLTSNL